MTSSALLGSRTESFRFDLLDADEAPLGRLPGVLGGKLEWSIGNTVKGGGTLEWRPEPDQATTPDWLSCRVKVTYRLTAEGQPYSWPAGVFLAGAAPADYTSTGPVYKIELYDKLIVPAQDVLDEAFSLDTGTVVTSAVRDLLESTGERNLAVTESAETLAQPLTWDAGTSKLRVINDLLAAINYWSLWCDATGQYRVEPYQRPGLRPVQHTFVDGEDCIYLPRFTVDADYFAVPNKMVCIAQTDGDTEPLVSVRLLDDIDPDSPYTAEARGRTIAQVVSDVAATSQDVLDDIADRKLREAAQVTRTFKVEHAWLPLSLNDVVRFTNRPTGQEATCTLTAFEVALKPGGLVRSTLREVLA